MAEPQPVDQAVAVPDRASAVAAYMPWATGIAGLIMAVFLVAFARYETVPLWLPIGLHIMANHFAEATMLRAAAAFEASAGFECAPAGAAAGV